MSPALLMSTLSATATVAATLPNEPVRTLDLKRYAGLWHEIAHLPVFFQRRCVDTISATCTIRPDGHVAVHNAVIRSIV